MADQKKLRRLSEKEQFDWTDPRYVHAHMKDIELRRRGTVSGWAFFWKGTSNEVVFKPPMTVALIAKTDSIGEKYSEGSKDSTRSHKLLLGYVENWDHFTEATRAVLQKVAKRHPTLQADHAWFVKTFLPEYVGFMQEAMWNEPAICVTFKRKNAVRAKDYKTTEEFVWNQEFKKQFKLLENKDDTDPNAVRKVTSLTTQMAAFRQTAGDPDAAEHKQQDAIRAARTATKGSDSEVKFVENLTPTEMGAIIQQLSTEGYDHKKVTVVTPDLTPIPSRSLGDIRIKGGSVVEVACRAYPMMESAPVYGIKVVFNPTVIRCIQGKGQDQSSMFKSEANYDDDEEEEEEEKDDKKEGENEEEKTDSDALAPAGTEGETQVPEGEFQIPEGETQVPEGGSQIPEGESQIPEGESQVLHPRRKTPDADDSEYDNDGSRTATPPTKKQRRPRK